MASITNLEKVTDTPRPPKAPGMDRKIEKRGISKRNKMIMGILGAAIIAYLSLGQIFQGHSMTVNVQRLSIATVKSGTFEDFIPLRVRVAPLKTVFLDIVVNNEYTSLFLCHWIFLKLLTKLFVIEQPVFDFVHPHCSISDARSLNQENI